MLDIMARMDGGPIFIVGSMRSGSTMLRLILDSHPRIAIGGETGFMGALLATQLIPGWKHGAEWFGRIGWTEQQYYDWSDRLMQAHYAFVTPTAHAGEVVTRFAVVNPRTTVADITGVLDTMA